MARHIVLDDDYGCALENLAKVRKQNLGDCTESLLDTIPEVQIELTKVRKAKK